MVILSSMKGDICGGELSRLHIISDSPWMCIGDFNEILSQEEKIGLRPHCSNKINLFKEFVNEAELMDMVLRAVNSHG